MFEFVLDDGTADIAAGGGAAVDADGSCRVRVSSSGKPDLPSADMDHPENWNWSSRAEDEFVHVNRIVPVQPLADERARAGDALGRLGARWRNLKIKLKLRGAGWQVEGCKLQVEKVGASRAEKPSFNLQLSTLLPARHAVRMIHFPARLICVSVPQTRPDSRRLAISTSVNSSGK